MRLSRNFKVTRLANPLTEFWNPWWRPCCLWRWLWWRVQRDRTRKRISGPKRRCQRAPCHWRVAGYESPVVTADNTLLHPHSWFARPLSVLYLGPLAHDTPSRLITIRTSHLHQHTAPHTRVTTQYTKCLSKPTMRRASIFNICFDFLGSSCQLIHCGYICYSS